MKKKKPWYKIVWLNLKKRWVQVVTFIVSGLLVMGITAGLLAPKNDRAAKEKETAEYKFIHCSNWPKCKIELTHNESMVNKRCSVCVDPRSVGYMVATKKSMTAGGDPWKWKWMSVAAAFEAVAILAGVVFILYLPIVDPRTMTYITSCPQCGQRLKFRRVSLGGLGACSRCKKPIRFPDEDEAVLEADLIREQDRVREKLLTARHAANED